MKRTILSVAIGAAFGSAWGAPTGAQVVNGAALFSNPSATVQQVVNTPGTIINWQSFSIGAGETTRFVQSNAASAVLNRVSAGNPSSILGRLESNGRVFLVNPNGIVFGAGAVVDVAGLIASTRDISNADFTAGNYLFSSAGNGAITVQAGAQILTSTYGPGGQVWLFAKNVTQDAGSTITAPQGQVVLAAGSTVQVATAGNGNMLFNVTTDGSNTVDSLGTIAADRGGVGLFADFINHRGTISVGNQGSVDMNAANELRIQGASQINAPDGTITLRGGSLLEVEYDSVINADGANGKISFESNNLLVAPSGNTHAVGGQVTFLQTQPTQYLEGGTQNAWVTPPGFSDNSAIVYRAADGNFVVRFQRSNSTTGDAVGLFEVVLNGRTGALVSGPVAIAAGSAEALEYNAANAGPRNYTAARAAADATYKAKLTQLADKEQEDFDQATKLAADQVDGTSATKDTIDSMITDRINAINDLLAAAQADPSAHPNLEFEISNIRGGSRTVMFNRIYLTIYDSLRFPPNLLPSASAADEYNVNLYAAKLSELHTQLFADQDAAAAASAAANDAATAALNAATANRPIALSAYNASQVAGISVFYSDSGDTLQGMPTSIRIPTSDGGATVALRSADRFIPPGGGESGNDPARTEYGGQSTGFELRTSSGAVIDTGLSGNPIPMPDGTYLAHYGYSYDVYKLDGTFVRSDSPSSFGATVIPNRLGGFSLLQVNGDGAKQQTVFTKDVPAYTPANNAVGAGGAAAAFVMRPGLANGTPLSTGSDTPPPGAGGTPATPPPVVSGGPNGGATLDESNPSCNAAVCTGALGDTRRAEEAQRAAEADRARPRDIGNITLREFLDALIAADKAGEGGRIDDQDAIVAVQALYRAAGRGGAVSNEGIAMLQSNMQDNGELRQLVLGWGDLGAMSPEGRLQVLQNFMEVQNRDQRRGVEGQGLSANDISISNIVSNLTTRDEMTIFMNTLVNATAGLFR